MSTKGKFVSDRYEANYFLQMNKRRRDTKMCYYGAWHWFLSEAAFQNHMQSYKGKALLIKRGEVPTSSRRMQEAFNWDSGRVKRFLDELEKVGKIKVRTKTPFTIITICNYDKIQKFTLKTDTQKPTKKDTRQAASITNDKRTNEKEGVSGLKNKKSRKSSKDILNESMRGHDE